MEFLIALCVFISIGAAAYAVATRRESTDLNRRLRGPAPDDSGQSTSPRPSSGLPQLLLSLTQRLLPANLLDGIQRDLTKAGDPLSLQEMVLIWAVGILGLPLIYALLVLSRGAGLSKMQLLSLVAAPVLGYYVPRIWLKGQISKRRKLIVKALPDAMDLITTSVEAGLGIDAAFGRVADKGQGPLADEIRRCLREMSLGRTRREALMDLVERTELPDIRSFVGAVVQAEHTGVSLGQVTRIQAEQLRMRRRQRAEQQAQKAPVKMVIPLVLFIFPAMFIVILGPAAIQILTNH
jgi:tight adherence protein C